jgi:hypothetical protein
MVKQRVKLPMCLANEALCYEEVWRSGCIVVGFIDLGTIRGDWSANSIIKICTNLQGWKQQIYVSSEITCKSSSVVLAKYWFVINVETYQLQISFSIFALQPNQHTHTSACAWRMEYLHCKVSMPLQMEQLFFNLPSVNNFWWFTIKYYH